MERNRSLPSWVQGVVIAACAITVMAAGVGARELWLLDSDAVPTSKFWFQNGLAIALGAWIIATGLPGSRTSRALRVAVLLPVAHAIALSFAWLWWRTHAASLPLAQLQTPLEEELPLVPVIATLALLCVLTSVLVTRRRRHERVQATAMMALSFLLLLGLWLPLACRWWGPAYFPEDARLVMILPAHGLVALALLPPMLGAIAFTAFAMHRGVHTPSARVWLALGAGCLFLGAIGARVGAPSAACVAYANFFHVLLGAGLVAIASLVVLGATNLARRERRGRIEGVIAGDVPVAGFEIRSWLRGPTPVVGGFVARTAHGDIPIAPGAALDLPLPPETIAARLGEGVAALRGGDRVTLAGFDLAGAEGHPFRGSHLPQPGSDGISVGAAGCRGFANAALATWRPCVAYLLILVAVALPALASTIRPPEDDAELLDRYEPASGYRADLPSELDFLLKPPYDPSFDSQIVR
jgi:hypothetical protein